MTGFLIFVILALLVVIYNFSNKQKVVVTPTPETFNFHFATTVRYIPNAVNPRKFLRIPTDMVIVMPSVITISGSISESLVIKETINCRDGLVFNCISQIDGVLAVVSVTKSGKEAKITYNNSALSYEFFYN